MGPVQAGQHEEPKRAEADMRVGAGSGLTLVARTGRAVALDGFRAPIRTGRSGPIRG